MTLLLNIGLSIWGIGSILGIALALSYTIDCIRHDQIDDKKSFEIVTIFLSVIFWPIALIGIPVIEILFRASRYAVVETKQAITTSFKPKRKLLPSDHEGALSLTEKE